MPKKVKTSDLRQYSTIGLKLLLVLEHFLVLCGFKTLEFSLQKHNTFCRIYTERVRKFFWKTENCDSCVQVLHIWFYFKFNSMNPIPANDFLTSHGRFENPRYMFENDHVMVSGEYIMFTEAWKEMELWRIEYVSFIQLAQVIFGQKPLVVPPRQFHRMAEELGDPKAESSPFSNRSTWINSFGADYGKHGSVHVNLRARFTQRFV